MPFLIFGEKKGNRNIIFQCQSFTLLQTLKLIREIFKLIHDYRQNICKTGSYFLASFLPLSSYRISACFREYTFTHPGSYLESLVLEFCLIKNVSSCRFLHNGSRRGPRWWWGWWGWGRCWSQPSSIKHLIHLRHCSSVLLSLASPYKASRHANFTFKNEQTETN